MHRSIISRKISNSFYVRITGKWKQVKIRRFEYETVEVNVYVAFILICFARHRLVLRHVSVFKRKKRFGLFASLLHERYTTEATTTQRDVTNVPRDTGHSVHFVHVRAYSYKLERGTKI